MTSAQQYPHHQHRAERTFAVAASPEEVWEAIATAEGVSAWLVPMSLDPTVGGRVSLGDADSLMHGTVTAYAPPQRFAFETTWPLGEKFDDVPEDMLSWIESIGGTREEVARDLPALGPVATEYLVEAQSGGSCIVRVVTSSYGSGADWENEFFAQMVSDTLDERLADYLKRMTRS